MIQTLEIPRIPSLDCLDERVVEEMQTTPALIIEQGPISKRTEPSKQCFDRLNEAGTKLADLVAGRFVLEKADLNAHTGVPEHVDGNTEEFWQGNCSWGTGIGVLLRKPGALFTINEYFLEEPLEEGLFKQIVWKGHDPCSPESSFYFKSDMEQNRTGIVSVLLRESKPSPTLRRSWTGFVPLGAVVFFVNGTGKNSSTLYTHTTSSAYNKNERETKTTELFRRTATLGRIEVPGGAMKKLAPRQH